MLATKDNPNLKIVFTTKSGVNFYAHHDPLTISPERGVSAEEARRYSEMCLSKKEMKALIQEYKKGVNNQDIVYSHSIIQEMEFRLNYIVEENSMFDLACLYFFIDGENVKTPSEAFNNKKRELYKSDPDVRGFFLPIALNLMKKFSELPDTDLSIYLEEMKNQVKRVHRYIATNAWTRDESSSTT
jgi:hypothetical protein